MSWTKNQFFLTKLPEAVAASPPPRRELSTKKNIPLSSPRRPSTLWKSLKVPVLFGAGLYIGLMTFGEHQETGEGSAFFAVLQGMFYDDNLSSGKGGNGDKHRKG